MASNNFSLRPIREDDTVFLRELYASTREAELETVGWPDEQKQAFVDMQFNAQHAHYQTHYGDATFDIVMLDDQPAGRLYVHRGEKDVRIVDVSITPNERSKGLGTQIISRLIEEAKQTKRTVSIHVENFNPARRLYDRLGFKHVEDNGVYHLMEWKPQNKPVPSIKEEKA